MKSVYARVLGDDTADLHPKVCERYGDEIDEDVICVGTGSMDIDHGALALPALYAMTGQNLLFPETGTDVPFTVTSAEYRTDAGRHVLGMRLEFDFQGTVRRFDSRTLWDAAGDRLLDFLGTDGRLVSELHPSVDDGALVVEGGRQWLRLGRRYVRLPGPFAADVSLRDHYHDDTERYRLRARLSSTLTGEILSYDGTFTQEFDANREIPAYLRPGDEFESLPPR